MIDWMGLFYCAVLYAGVWAVDYKYDLRGVRNAN
jgi:hypothetical protein